MYAPFYEMPWQDKIDAAAWRGSTFCHSLRWPLLNLQQQPSTSAVEDEAQ